MTLSLALFLCVSINAEDVFYKSCDPSKTSANLVSTSRSCKVGICEMRSYCETNKGSMYVSHLCPSDKDGKCPAMIDCLDNSSIEIKEDEIYQATSRENGMSNGGTGVAK